MRGNPWHYPHPNCVWNFYLTYPNGYCKRVLTLTGLMIDEGWALGGAERDTRDNYDGPEIYRKYWNMQVWAYYPQGYWTWTNWTQPNDWTFRMWAEGYTDNDPNTYYEFQRVGDIPSNTMRLVRT